MTSLRDAAARRRMQLNPITTSLNVAQHQSHLQTPLSALSSSSLSAPFAYNPSYTPISAVRQQYNPQAWTASPNVTPESGSHFRPQDPEAFATAPPPPPYSPPRSNRTSMNEEPLSGVSPASRISPANQYRSSPEPTSNPVFPPPPPSSSRARAGSSDRPPSLFHNISSFARRTTAEPPREPPRVSPEISRDNGPRRPMPISIEAPSSESEGSQHAETRPPASRRAASTGAISTPSSSRSCGSSTNRWEPGMPLPPPPPGPPPPQSRSQSMTRSTDRVVSPPTRRPPPMSTLGPVPPTPAGWVDEDVSGRGRSPNRGLTIDTSSVSSSNAPESNSGSSSSGLARAHAMKGDPRTIRQRRNESKTRRTAAATEEASNNPWAEAIVPSDIVVPTVGLARRPTITRSTPRSARSHQEETPRTGESLSVSQHNTPVQLGPSSTASRGSTPRPQVSSNRLEAPTPPFSPNQFNDDFAEDSPAIPPKALPTPPLQSQPQSQSRLSVGSPSNRPVSHILHTANNDSAVMAPLVPSRPDSRQSSASQVSQISPAEQFSRAAIERHQAFAQKEAAAATDSERVRIFADFIVAESRLRRERYATAIDAMGSEILELTRDLFRPYANSRRESNTSRSSNWTPESSAGPRSPIPTSRSHRGSLTAALHDTPKLNTNIEPLSGSMPGSGSRPGSADGNGNRPESTWWTGYMPSLSPIPSMSVSEAPDGSDSRGRPSSRWWEVSQEGSTGAPSTRLERSKRESKYMGMPKELREAMQFETLDTPNGKGIDMSGPSQQRSDYGPDEYPQEKVGWHDQDLSLQKTPSKSPAMFSPALMTPNPHDLDVSRLVTLPPPYPRHHPAVNNNHPDLTAIRTTVRQLSDYTEVEATKERFTHTSAQMAEEQKVAATKRRNSLRQTISREIEAGTMTYADAAAMEASAAASEAEKTKKASKVDFELFQSQVVIPLNDLLMDRVARATELFDQLKSKLFVDAQEQNPTTTQEEGDEQPELLEKLTLLKWIFEAREQLHRELFDLLSDRNDRYKDMVITPYRLANNNDKVANAESFFADDATKRKLAFEQEVLKRTEEFLDVIEENVVRGVEVQLSAFWDIAPSLSRIIEKIPRGNLDGFRIQIPAAEYEENESYVDFPMQYLYSLLGHCEKSTYQFIESQINLLCLLHEVKSGVTAANCRLMRAQRVQQGEKEEDVERELGEVETDEEVRLTDDLKEKVRVVEELWGSALGRELGGCKGMVEGFLKECGGWDDDQS
ncbi:uncharacterized protein LY89DRAFT_384646 [Mollisia scopiformis]|uniref:Uncharacterized protein n=1 Tax=Mollisia scopiformis TaxID=149040 RepID=A0A194XNR5_MOLSC|nr:uncharacterized protein LY89DRAFT_384646 [Mollisia scopiformis]KUJ21801.1 hypothetical protein LY89DRAFT_384646 [Mollisia scopiformis]